MPFEQSKVAGIRLPHRIEGVAEHRHRTRGCIEDDVCSDPEERDLGNVSANCLNQDCGTQKSPQCVSNSRNQSEDRIQPDAESSARHSDALIQPPDESTEAGKANVSCGRVVAPRVSLWTIQR